MSSDRLSREKQNQLRCWHVRGTMQGAEKQPAGTRRNPPCVDVEACCRTQDDGSVKCWGYNDFGQLGYGDTSTRGDGSNGSPLGCDGPALVMLGD